MSKKPSSIDIKNFYRLKETKAQNEVDSLQNKKESLRDMIMDFVLYKSFKEKEKQKNQPMKLSLCKQKLRKLPIEFQIQLNDQKHKLKSTALTIVQMFVQQEEKNMFQELNIELFVNQLISFIQQISQNKQQIQHQLISDEQILTDQIVQHIVKKHFKEKQRLNRLKDLSILKSKTFKNNQNIHQKLQSPNDPQQLHRFSRNTITSTNQDKDSQISSILNKNNKSKLKDLVDNYKVFQFPQKITKLKNQKIKQLYDGIDIDEITIASKKQFANLVDPKADSEDTQGLQFLQNWITEIDISEKLFLKKLQKSQKKQKGKQIKVGKIIEQSEEEEKQIQPTKKLY